MLPVRFPGALKSFGCLWAGRWIRNLPRQVDSSEVEFSKYWLAYMTGGIQSAFLPIFEHTRYMNFPLENSLPADGSDLLTLSGLPVARH
jgi:hypothetical protein